eukprot:Pgem_evm1s14760
MFFSAIICRMRLVYIVFTTHKRCTVSEYYKPIPIMVLLMFISFIPAILEGVYPNKTIFTAGSANHTALVGCIVIGVIYPLWIGFYTLKCRKVSEQYSDFYINIRVAMLMMSLIIISVLITNIIPDKSYLYCVVVFV